MSFLYPSFLFFLGLVSIPIIIHLFHFRRYKTIYFSSLQFLFNVAKETKSRNKLKHLLVLLARILTVICLVFAFSQPFIPAQNKVSNSKKEIVALYLDNSFSMDAEGTNGNLLEEAKSNALEIVSAYPPSTDFLLITNDFEPRHQHILNKDQLSDYVSAIHSSPRNAVFSDIIERTKQLTNQNKSQNNFINLCLLSDYQKYSFNVDAVSSDSSMRFMIFTSVPLAAKNLSIDSCWFEYPNHNFNQLEKLQVMIRNYSDESYQNIPVKLYINDSVKTVASFSIEKNTSETITLSYSNISKGTIRGKIEIADYPITYDNYYYFNYDVTDNIKILGINGVNSFQDFYNLFRTDSLFSYDVMNEKNINYSILSSFQVIILNGLSAVSTGLQQELQSFIAKGGSIVFIPPTDGKINDYSTFLKFFGFINTQTDTSKSQITQINEKAPFFKNVFQNIEENPKMPFINKHIVIASSKNITYDELFLSRNGDPIFIASDYEKGKLYLFTFPFDERFTDFMVHPLFVPVFYRIGTLSIIATELSYTIDANIKITIPNIDGNTDEIVELKNKLNEESFIPEQIKGNSEINIYPGSQIFSDGTFDILAKGKTISNVSFNYNRKESFPEYYSPDRLKELINDKGFNVSLFDNNNRETIASKITADSKGKPLWKYFILLALLFISAEIALVRFLK